jgi:hypothetical protein
MGSKEYIEGLERESARLGALARAYRAKGDTRMHALCADMAQEKWDRAQRAWAMSCSAASLMA